MAHLSGTPKPTMWGANMKHVKVYDEQHAQINATVRTLTVLFCKQAKTKSVKIQKRGKNRNIPGQPDAAKCLLTYDSPDLYVERMFRQGAV